MELFLHYLSMPYLLQGISLTLGVTGLGLAGGLFLGTLLACMQMSRQRWLSGIARTYSVIFRGTPLILQMVFFYDALPYIGLRLSPLVAAGLALAANEAPFIAEILRAGIRGVDRGQTAAGQALGMSSMVLMRRIIAPQAIRIMVPAFGSEAVSALKNSSLASIISVQELTLRSTQLASSTFDFFSVFVASGVLYLVLTCAISVVQLMTESVLDLDTVPARKPGIRWPFFMRAITPALQASNDIAPPDTAALVPSDSSAGHTDTVAEVQPVRARDLTQGAVMVEVQGLAKHFARQRVFSGLDLKVRVGEVIALLGPSGSGKSTLLRCINRLETWDAGTVRIGGQYIGLTASGVPMTTSGLAAQRAAIGIGMVFQQFNLFAHLSALENIAGPLRWVHGMSAAAAEQRGRDLLARVGLSERADALPRHLSGGQQQRVAIARALAPRPGILLLDEPTSALDPELVNEVLDVIRRLAVEEGLTMIISTHQVQFAREVADRVVFLSNGSVIEEGPADDVLSRPQNALTARFLRVMGAQTQGALIS